MKIIVKAKKSENSSKKNDKHCLQNGNFPENGTK
jgi:hypothetical protein